MELGLKIVKSFLDAIVIFFILVVIGVPNFNNTFLSCNSNFVVSFGWVYLVITFLSVFVDDEKESKKPTAKEREGIN